MHRIETSRVDDSSTRAQVTLIVLQNGPISAAEIAEELDLTAAAVRRHLDQLLADGHVETRERRGPRGRGRPAKVYVITDAGRERFTHSYDDLAVQALEFLSETGGDEAVTAFARARLADLESRLAAQLQDAPPPERLLRLTEALSDAGFVATYSETGTGTQLCQHHCPVANVAEKFGHLCEAEAEMFSRLLDTHVQRLATIAHGDGVCTTHLPNPHPERVSS